jgi:KDO2-lipid IV(A) lauroyltransferase
MQQEQNKQDTNRSCTLHPEPCAPKKDFIRWLMLPLAILPLRVMYVFSDLVYYLVYYLARYRRALVKRNLDNSFPQKTPTEKTEITKAFYHHFCDYYFETVKLLHISDEEMKRRFVFNNIEIIDSYLKTNRPVILMLGHYGNWEWVTSITLWVKEKHTTIGQIYRPLKNKPFDRFFLNLRKRFHSVGFAKNDIYREIIKMRRANQNWLLGFIADQKPSANSLHYWTTFLNQDTPVIIGAERIAKQTNAVLCYLDITQVKRGYYEGNIKLISDCLPDEPEYAVTEQYMRLSEKTILRNPALWLWTHNRWKFKRENHS